MSSRTPKGALYSGDSSTEQKDIEDFLRYLIAWKAVVPEVPKKRRCKSTKEELMSTPNKKRKISINDESVASQQSIIIDEPKGTRKGNREPKDSDYFLTDNTFVGLRVTLQATLDIFDYLTRECAYKFLMTSRLNQDNLERLFGMIGSAGGNNDHPNSVNFLYLYKLLSAYSLLKPAKGSNVQGEELFKAFLDSIDANEILGHERDLLTPQEKCLIQLDNAVSRGTPDVLLNEMTLRSAKYFIVEYFAGYVLRNKKKFIDCEECVKSMTAENSTSDSLITKRDKFGVLTIPAPQLVMLLKTVEDIIAEEATDASHVKPDTFFTISSRLDDESVTLPLVGCEEHNDRVSMQVLQFFIMMRMNLLCRAGRKMLTDTCGKLKKQAKFSCS